MQKWELSLNNALKIEAIANNLDMFRTKAEIAKEIRATITSEYESTLVEIILKKYPFCAFRDSRYVFTIRYFFKSSCSPRIRSVDYSSLEDALQEYYSNLEYYTNCIVNGEVSNDLHFISIRIEDMNTDTPAIIKREFIKNTNI